VSKDKRINLTQFDGMTEGPWTKDLDDEGKRWIDAYVEGEGDKNIARITNGSREDAEAIAKLPDLIAELKKCYDFIESRGLDEDIEHKMVIDLRECSIELLDELCFQAGVETGTKEEMIARLLE